MPVLEIFSVSASNPIDPFTNTDCCSRLTSNSLTWPVQMVPSSVTRQGISCDRDRHDVSKCGRRHLPSSCARFSTRVTAPEHPVQVILTLYLYVCSSWRVDCSFPNDKIATHPRPRIHINYNRPSLSSNHRRTWSIANHFVHDVDSRIERQCIESRSMCNTSGYSHKNE